ncbi:MAG: prepilin peptidase [Alphaproteobacteria bacterium]|nr:prepilin peptidase [Alphaproteobacteria bacterium]
MNSLLLILISGVIGAMVASFLWVVQTAEKPKDIFFRRSSCEYCKKKLTPQMLVPIYSYIVQKGKCSFCKKKISPLYVVVESIVAVFSMWAVYLWLDEPYVLVPFVIGGVCLLVLSVADVVYQRVGSAMIYAFLIFSHAYAIYMMNVFGIIHQLIIAFVVALPFFLFWYLSKGKWMGEADFYIAWSVGMLVIGALHAYDFFLLTFFSGAIVGIGLYGIRFVGGTIKKTVPLIPFMAFGFIASYFISPSTLLL